MSTGQMIVAKGGENGGEVGYSGNGRNNHPLEMAEIIEHVLGYLPVKDLETSRLISTNWDGEASRLLRAKQTLVFKHPGTVQTYLDGLHVGSKLQHARFEFCIADLSQLTHERGLTEFWDTCGQHIKILELHMDRMYWQDLAEILSTKVPHLETLSFTHLPWQRIHTPIVHTKLHQSKSIKTLRLASLQSRHAILVRIQLVDILKALPNLQVIDVLDKQIPSEDSDILIKVLRKPEVSLPHLRRVSLHLTLNQELLNILANIRTSLQQLHITLEDGVQASSFKSLMSSLRPTLLELKVTFPNDFAKDPQNILEAHPEKYLCLLNNLRSLHLTNFKWPMEFVRKMTNSFKNLRCLHVNNVNDERLRVIYQSLPLLSELGLSNANCTDWGLTGISLEICNDILETCCRYEGAKKCRTALYIGSLQFLKKLTVIGSQSRITDVSVALGLAECRNLRELKVGSSLIFNKGIIFLVGRLGRQLNFLDVSECTALTDDTKFYVEAMTRGRVKISDSELPVEETTDGDRERERVVVKKVAALEEKKTTCWNHCSRMRHRVRRALDVDMN